MDDSNNIFSSPDKTFIQILDSRSRSLDIVTTTTVAPEKESDEHFQFFSWYPWIEHIINLPKPVEKETNNDNSVQEEEISAVDESKLPITSQNVIPHYKQHGLNRNKENNVWKHLYSTRQPLSRSWVSYYSPRYRYQYSYRNLPYLRSSHAYTGYPHHRPYYYSK